MKRKKNNKYKHKINVTIIYEIKIGKMNKFEILCKSLKY